MEKYNADPDARVSISRAMNSRFLSSMGVFQGLPSPQTGVTKVSKTSYRPDGWSTLYSEQF